MGVTFSASEDLKAWGGDVGYGGDLLSDSERSLAMAYGAAESPHQERPSRVSVLVGPDGKVAKTYEVSDAEAHPGDVLADLD